MYGVLQGTPLSPQSYVERKCTLVFMAMEGSGGAQAVEPRRGGCDLLVSMLVTCAEA